MRILFFGASKLGYKCAEALIKKKHDIIGFFSIPEKFSITYNKKEKVEVNNCLFTNFKILSDKYNIPIYFINQNINDYIEIVKDLKPDFILCVGWYYSLPQSIIDLPKKGVAGIHASLLPKYRGNAPLVWALINGEKETGVSFFYFEKNKGIDAGDIIAQIKIKIKDFDTINDLLIKCEKSSVRLLLENIPLIEKGISAKISQDEDLATIFPKRTPDDGLIDWSWSSDRIKNFIRAQTKPYPGAYTLIDGKKIIIWDADIEIIK